MLPEQRFEAYGSVMGLWGRKKAQPEPAVVDLREQVELTAPRPVWGAPVACPECGGRGYLDHIDPFREVMFQHCTQCDTKYEIAKADLEPST